MLIARNIATVYGILSIALIFFSLIVASTKHYQSRGAFWFRVVLAWLSAYILAGILFIYLKVDTILVIMVSSLAGYLVMGDLPYRKKTQDELFHPSSEDEKTAND